MHSYEFLPTPHVLYIEYPQALTLRVNRSSPSLFTPAIGIQTARSPMRSIDGARSSDVGPRSAARVRLGTGFERWTHGILRRCPPEATSRRKPWSRRHAATAALRPARRVQTLGESRGHHRSSGGPRPRQPAPGAVRCGTLAASSVSRGAARYAGAVAHRVEIGVRIGRSASASVRPRGPNRSPLRRGASRGAPPAHASWPAAA